MMRMSVRPTRTASSTTYWIDGLSTTGSISFGWLLVAGRKRGPRPAAGMTALVTGDVMDAAATLLVGARRPSHVGFLAPQDAPQALHVADDHQARERRGHDDVDLVLPYERDRDGERERDDHRRDRRLLQHARDEEPHDHRDEADDREQREHDATRGRDAATALEVLRDRPDVPDHRREAEHPRAAVPRDADAHARVQRALADVEQEHEEPGPPAHEPEHVRRARVARPL